VISEIPPDFRYHKKPSGQDRTAAERKYIAKAIRRRRGILQSRILYYEWIILDKKVVDK
jgi:hypothetical protein